MRQLVRDFGTCLSFNGSTAKVATPTITPGINSARSVSFWVKPNKPSANQMMAISYQTGSSATWNFYVRWKSTLNIEFGASSGTNSVTTSASALLSGMWSHIVYTAGASDTQKLYVNGVLDANQSGALASNFTFRGATHSWDIANYAGAEWFLGQIDDFRMFERILTQTDVTNLYLNPDTSIGNNIVWYKFDEGSGTTATDSSGAGNAGTITAASYSTDVVMKPRTVATQRQIVRDFGTCISLNNGGATSSVDIGNDVSLQLTSAWTLAAWVKPRTRPAGSGIISNVFGTNIVYELSFGVADNSSTLQAGFYTGGTWYYSQASGDTGKENVGKWVHVAATYDGTKITTYVNGVSMNVYTPATTPTTNANHYLIGRRHDTTGPAPYFPGSIDDVRIYNTALSGNNITNLYYGIEPSSSSLVSWYKFDEGSGTTAIDSKGTNTGTITSGVYSSDVFMKPRGVVS